MGLGNGNRGVQFVKTQTGVLLVRHPIKPLSNYAKTWIYMHHISSVNWVKSDLDFVSIVALENGT